MRTSYIFRICFITIFIFCNVLCFAQNKSQNPFFVRGSLGLSVIDFELRDNLIYPSASLGIGIQIPLLESSNIKLNWINEVGVNRLGSKRRIDFVNPQGSLRETNNLINLHLNTGIGLQYKRVNFDLGLGYYINMYKSSQIVNISSNAIIANTRYFETILYDTSFKNRGLILFSRISYSINNQIELGLTLNSLFIEGRNALNSQGLRYLRLDNLALQVKYNLPSQ